MIIHFEKQSFDLMNIAYKWNTAHGQILNRQRFKELLAYKLPINEVND